MKSRKSIVVLIAITLLYGCQTFYKINNDELQDISTKDVLQIKFESGRKLNITNIQHANITSNNELEIIKYSSTKYKLDSVRTIYPLSKINEIRVEKFDVQKSIFTTLWIVIGVPFAIAMVFYLMGTPISVGG